MYCVLETNTKYNNDNNIQQKKKKKKKEKNSFTLSASI